jgi:hypothetical protein
MAAERAERAARKNQAVEALLGWIRSKASAAGVGNTVHWGVLKFVVSKPDTAFSYSGVYEDYPINSLFPANVNSGIQPVVLSGTITTGSPIITGLSSTSNLSAGMGVSGTNIPSGSKIISIDSSNQVTISQNATGSGSQSITFTKLWTSINGDNVQETLRRDGFDRGTRVDIAIVGQHDEVQYTIFVVDQEMLARDIVDTNSRELSRIMRKKILYAKVHDILWYVHNSQVPDKFPGFVF